MPLASIRQFLETDDTEWRRLRHTLWPATTDADHETDLREYKRDPATHVIFVAERTDGTLAGFAEVRLRSHVDACVTSPVAFLEGWYVDLAERRQGVGRALLEAAEAWARARNCQEFGSDAELDNLMGRAAHRALGFEEGVPTVNFRKTL